MYLWPPALGLLVIASRRPSAAFSPGGAVRRTAPPRIGRSLPKGGFDAAHLPPPPTGLDRRRRRSPAGTRRWGAADGSLFSASASSRKATAPPAAVLTSAVLKIAFDGTNFNGWTAGNASDPDDGGGDGGSGRRRNGGDRDGPPKVGMKRRSSRSRKLTRRGRGDGGKNGGVRTVEGALRNTLAKIYGDVPPDRVRFEACSRTDAGVHSSCTVARFHCLSSDAPPPEGGAVSHGAGGEDERVESTIEPPADDRIAGGGERTGGAPRAEFLLPLPFRSDLSKLVFVLNRMLPPAVRVVAASPPPPRPESSPPLPPFHPTLRVLAKTYVYTFAIGAVHDPLGASRVWHLDGSSGHAIGMNGRDFRFGAAAETAAILANAGTNGEGAADYAAFRSAFRGNERGRVQSTICTIFECELREEFERLPPSWEAERGAGAGDGGDAPGTEGYPRGGGSSLRPSRGSISPRSAKAAERDVSPRTFDVIVVGDRFLYKMVRNMVGAIVAAGCGHLEPSDVRRALETGRWDSDVAEPTYNGVEDEGRDNSDGGEGRSGHRKVRRICAPSRGLTLRDVRYPNNDKFDWQTG